ncbi:MAG: transglutaminase TgpA family protein [Candidatus Methylomirabilia bacterium]
MKTRPLSLTFSYTLCALAAIAAALAPLPRTGWVLLAAAGAAGALWDLRGLARVPSAVLTVIGLAGFFASLLPLHRETLAEQSLTALTFLLAIKIFAVKKRRDHLQILAVSLLVIAGAASLQPDLAFGVLLACALACGVFVLLWLPFSEEASAVDPGLLRRLAFIGMGLVAASAPITFLLFVLLPRSVSPFWAGLGGRPRQGVSGITDHLQLGDVGRVALSGEVAFRAEIEGGGPLPQTPYWRGAVLEVTDGRGWDISGRTRPATASAQGEGKRITYYVEPHGSRQLFLLETPSGATIGARTQAIGAARVLQLPLPLARRIRYTGRSVPADRFTERLLPEDRALNVRLPAALPGSIRALADGIAGSDPDPAAVAARLLAHFSTGYTYSLQLPVASGDPLESFLLGHRTGYCEYFASGLAVLLRTQGIPARVVSGYLGGDYVPVGAYYLVTQASAHAWVEAYLGGAWVRFDPTPASGELGSTYAARQGGRPRLWIDTLRMRWNSWVVQYDAESQLALARSGAERVRGARLDLRGAVRLAAVALGFTALTLGAIAVARRGATDQLAKRIARFEKLAARSGAAREPSEGPLDHAERFGRLARGAGPAVRRFGDTATACRFGGRPADAPTLAQLDALLRNIRDELRGG